MGRVRPYIAEVMRALLVLALILLNVAHQPPAIAADSHGRSDAVIHCGFSDTPDGNAHAPCHACRIGGDTIVPAAPCDAELVSLAFVDVNYVPTNLATQWTFDTLAHRSRAPPLLA